MKRITNVKTPRTRSYASPLRDERADETRRRILDALVRTMARGVAGLSVPAVAKEAGVSIPTVYRYFRTKADLVDALAPYLAEKSRLMEMPGEPTDVRAMVHGNFERHAALDPEVRAAMASELGGEVRKRNMPERLRLIRTAMKARAPRLTATELDRLTRIALILLATPTIRAFKDYLDLDPRVAADDVAWALDRLAGASRRG
jgi:AcrR family transcriptional regulator